MGFLSKYALPVAAMTLIVVVSNVLVQFPMAGHVGSLALADILTWGAFTYPFAFLVNDLTNRIHGPRIARRVVFVGFACAVAASIAAPPLLYDLGLMDFATAADRLARIAIASGTAFLLAQLLDIAMFNQLRRQSWWRAPAIGSLSGSVLDTLTFFTVAFAPLFAFVGPSDDFSLQGAPLLGLFAVEAPHWLSWALGDLVVKLLIAAFALVPYRVIMQAVMPYPTAPARG
ncbi:queuosine precursor transporter [Aurantimonas sp. MSK8Z-1]|uniref:queuosine precursor transporter n=1 Tax=Mangrovibrevibacter kandeliae TaxID=2968473 RepID=UPI0021174CBE|nr:queuosine precursor transporter [Aurantimonas sp. MSK8Z-1]MCW4116586.1 queuosine precursor transporter [Aurantimonas sp. MSK8Z-1]